MIEKLKILPFIKYMKITQLKLEQECMNLLILLMIQIRKHLKLRNF